MAESAKIKVFLLIRSAELPALVLFLNNLEKKFKQNKKIIIKGLRIAP